VSAWLADLFAIEQVYAADDEVSPASRRVGPSSGSEARTALPGRRPGRLAGRHPSLPLSSRWVPCTQPALPATCETKRRRRKEKLDISLHLGELSRDQVPLSMLRRWSRAERWGLPPSSAGGAAVRNNLLLFLSCTLGVSIAMGMSESVVRRTNCASW
jgi:hypothetical protein